MLQDLKQLGFTPNEIKVYESLLKIGETAVGGIINDLKVHGQIVYNALDALEKRGMISKTMKNKVYHFKVGDPTIILENIQKQELIAKRLTDLIKLEIGKSKFENSINIYNGKEGLRKCFLEMVKDLPTNSTINVIQGAVSKYEQSLGLDFIKNKLEPIRAKRGILSKIIMSENFRQEYKEFSKKINSKIRQTKYLPFDKTSSVMTQIYENHVLFTSISDDLFAIDIKNKEFYKSYLNQFETLWKMAKK